MYFKFAFVESLHDPLKIMLEKPFSSKGTYRPDAIWQSDVNFQWHLINFNIFLCFFKYSEPLKQFNYLVCISCKIFIRWRFYLFLKTENLRCRFAFGLCGPLSWPKLSEERPWMDSNRQPFFNGERANLLRHKRLLRHRDSRRHTHWATVVKKYQVARTPYWKHNAFLV
jgi:hypothetical protein